jgi:hypothetical protein
MTDTHACMQDPGNTTQNTSMALLLHTTRLTANGSAADALLTFVELGTEMLHYRYS